MGPWLPGGSPPEADDPLGGEGLPARRRHGNRGWNLRQPAHRRRHSGHQGQPKVTHSAMSFFKFVFEKTIIVDYYVKCNINSISVDTIELRRYRFQVQLTSYSYPLIACC